MAGSSGPVAAAPRPVVDQGRFWAGALATALVAALIAVAGTVLLKGVFALPVVVPTGLGSWTQIGVGWYAFAAGMGGLVAAAVMFGLIRFTPRPKRFFAWMIGLATLCTVLAPFGTTAKLAAELGTAGLNLTIGIAIGTLVAGTTRGATRAARSQRGRPPGTVRPYQP